jgi:protein-arginine kinase
MWFLSDEDGTIEKASGAGVDFPKNRAIIFNGRRNFTVHVNDGDHIRVTCMTHFGDLLENYKKLNKILHYIKSSKKLGGFNTHKNYGYVTQRIADMGCGLNVSMVLNLPHTYDANPEDFVKSIESKYHVETKRVLTIREKKTYMVYAVG